MTFNEKMIGRFVIDNTTEYIDLPKLRMIVAYDFTRHRYLSVEPDISISEAWRTYQKVNSLSDTFDIKEALDWIDEKIANNDAELNNLMSKIAVYKHVSDSVIKENYRNELMRLANSYYCTNRELRDLDGYINSERLSEQCRKIYNHEYIATQKALRRLEKRFHYYFGDNADIVMSMFAKTSFSDIWNKMSKCKNNIIKYAKHKEKIQEYYRSVKQTILS